MSPEAQRIAIAEACGWQCVYSEVFPDGFGGFDYGALGMPPKHNLRRVLPDYLSDLNAMHEAEKVLTTEQFFKYCDTLSGVLDGHHARGVVLEGFDAWRIHTPAKYRAEAFLRTLGKWQDS